MVEENKKWKLRGAAYGRTYDETMDFVEKEIIPVPDDVVEQHLSIAINHRNDPEYREMISKQERATFRTDKGNTVIVSPRYVGSRLGSDDDGQGNTICALFYNDEYVALAFYNEQKREIVAHEY